MLDLELRGIVPSGYFDDVETAMSQKKIRRENIIHDLTERLNMKPEFSGKLAEKLMSKAMDSMKKRNEIVDSGKSAVDKEVIREILVAKLSERMDYEQLKQKNILPLSYYPTSAQKLMAATDELRKSQLSNKLESQLNARLPAQDLYDHGLVKYKIGQNGLASTLHDVASNLEDKYKQRVDENYLRNKGIYFDSQSQKEQSQIINKLDSKMKTRPSIGSMERTGIVPQGAMYDPTKANQTKHDRIQSIHDELNAFFEYDRPSKDEIIKKGYFYSKSNKENGDTKRRDSVKIIESPSDSEEEEEPQQPESPHMPGTPPRGSAIFQQNTYTEIVMKSIQDHNKRVIEPSYEIDVLVAEPDLNDDIIQTSTLSFLNILNTLNKIISKKNKFAKKNFILKMNNKSTHLQSIKNLLRNLQQYGSAIINEQFDGITNFKSCGDVDKDIENLWLEINQQQTELYELDNKYRPLHFEIKKLQNIKYELEEYYDKYKIQLSQLKRIKKRISSYIEENKMIKDSSNEAIKATDEQQADDF